MVTLQEKTATGLIRGLLFGGGEAALKGLKPLIARSGAVDSRLLPELAKGTPRLQKLLHGIKGLAVGHKPLEILKQRFLQGGIAGKGGLLHGAYALNPELMEAMSSGGKINPRQILPAIAKHPGQAAGDLVNLGWMAGLPAYTSLKAVQRGDRPELGKTLGETLGYSLAGPFNLASAIAGSKGGDLGRQLLTPQMPEMTYEPKFAGVLDATAAKPAPLNVQPPPSPIAPSATDIMPRPPGGLPSPMQIQQPGAAQGSQPGTMPPPQLPKISLR